MPAQEHPSIVSKFKDGSFTYEQRFVDCGSKACKRCTGPDGRKATHGPYWYLCASKKGRWVRLYIGKKLDLKKHRTADGRIDPTTGGSQTSIFKDEAALGFSAKNPSTTSTAAVNCDVSKRPARSAPCCDNQCSLFFSCDCADPRAVLATRENRETGAEIRKKIARSRPANSSD